MAVVERSHTLEATGDRRLAAPVARLREALDRAVAAPHSAAVRELVGDHLLELVRLANQRFATTHRPGETHELRNVAAGLRMAACVLNQQAERLPRRDHHTLLTILSNGIRTLVGETGDNRGVTVFPLGAIRPELEERAARHDVATVIGHLPDVVVAGHDVAVLNLLWALRRAVNAAAGVWADAYGQTVELHIAAPPRAGRESALENPLWSVEIPLGTAGRLVVLDLLAGGRVVIRIRLALAVPPPICAGGTPASSGRGSGSVRGLRSGGQVLDQREDLPEGPEVENSAGWIDLRLVGIPAGRPGDVDDHRGGTTGRDLTARDHNVERLGSR